MTTVSDGLMQWGGAPVEGAHRFAGMWTGRVWFVDGTDGLDGNSGKTPSKAFLTIARAIAMAGTDDTIYIRPKAVGNYYTESLTVPVTTHAGLNIIGTRGGNGTSVYQACTLRCASNSVDAPVITANSSFLNLENLHFWSRAAQTHGFGVLARWNTPVGLALNIGSSIVNCGFSQDYEDHAATGEQDAIRFDSTEGMLVEGCQFRDCQQSISIGSTQSASYSIVIKNNLFKGIASNIAADIYATDVVGLNIVDNKFLHAVPSKSTGSLLKYIYCAGTVSGGMAGNYQGENEVAAGSNNTLSNIIASGNFGLGGPWTS